MSLYSAGVEYGIHCLAFLVTGSGDTREASVRDLAELQGVPVEYLAKIFTKLAKSKLVVASEGVRGGFSLARPADEITLLDIVNAIDGRKNIFECRDIRGRCALFEGNAPEWAIDGTCSIHGSHDDRAKAHGRSPRPTDDSRYRQKGRTQGAEGVRPASGRLDAGSTGEKRQRRQHPAHRHFRLT
jgi:Rrf2 family protein